MQILKTIDACKAWSKKQTSTIGFVPTMGALHNGHLFLVKQSKLLCAKTIVSIYINPTQFSPKEDLDSYPQTLEDDLDYLESLKVDAVFLPSDKEMYPHNKIDFIYKNNLFNKLEGKSRPHFFYGVTKVVSKLFNIINPTHAFFGEKDAQQSRVIKKMIYDLKLGINFISCPTIRDNNGLALSSRNNYLSVQDQLNASILYKSLMLVQDAIYRGEKKTKTLKNLFENSIYTNKNIKIDYISVACNDTLKELKTVRPNALISSAIFFKKVRLIDNFVYQSST